MALSRQRRSFNVDDIRCWLNLVEPAAAGDGEQPSGEWLLPAVGQFDADALPFTQMLNFHHEMHPKTRHFSCCQ